MKLPVPFIKLPASFDARLLLAELDAVCDDGWRAHNTGFEGNSACLLVRPASGNPEAFYGPLEASAQLRAMPYTEQVLRSFRTVVGRARLMRLAPGHGVPKHSDVNYYWRHRIRVHVPIQTDAAVRFHCGDQSVHMAPGEAWVFDNWRQHRVENASEHERIHLVFDTVGTAAFWRIVSGKERIDRVDDTTNFPLLLESVQKCSILSHYAVDQEMQYLGGEAQPISPSANDLLHDTHTLLHDFAKDWRTLSLMEDPVFVPQSSHLELLEEIRDLAGKIPKRELRCSNDTPFGTTLLNYLDTLYDAAATHPRRAT